VRGANKSLHPNGICSCAGDSNLIFHTAFDNGSSHAMTLNDKRQFVVNQRNDQEPHERSERPRPRARNSERIRRATSDDPALAVGSAKELIGSVRWVLRGLLRPSSALVAATRLRPGLLRW
jgi:hypothetical protein